MRGERGRNSILVELFPYGDLRQEMKVHTLMRTLRKKKRLPF